MVADFDVCWCRCDCGCGCRCLVGGRDVAEVLVEVCGGFATSLAHLAAGDMVALLLNFDIFCTLMLCVDCLWKALSSVNL